MSDEVGGGLLTERSSRGAAFGDVDNDVGVDVLVINLNERPTLLRNGTVSGNNWITSSSSVRSENRDAIRGRGAGSTPSERDRLPKCEAVAAIPRTMTCASVSAPGRRVSVPPFTVLRPGGEIERFSGLTLNGIHLISGTGEPGGGAGALNAPQH